MTLNRSDTTAKWTKRHDGGKAEFWRKAIQTRERSGLTIRAFSLARLIRITRTGQIVYRAEKHRPHRFPDPAADLFGGIARNFQIFEPLSNTAASGRTCPGHHRPAPRPGPFGSSRGQPVAEADAAVTYEAAPEYLEHARRNAIGEDQQPDLPCEA